MSRRLAQSFIASISLSLVAPFFGMAQTTWVTTSAYVAAPFCCDAVNLQSVLTVEVENDDPRYEPTDIYWQTKTDISNCDVFRTPWVDRSFCCVFQGNKSTIRQYYQPALCPVEAKSRSFALVGGNELPDYGDDDISICLRPCLGPEDCDGGSFP